MRRSTAGGHGARPQRGAAGHDGEHPQTPGPAGAASASTRLRPLVVAGLLVGEAARALARHKTRTALTSFSITIGIAAVVWVVAIGQAGAARAEDQLRALGDNLVWVEAGSGNVNGVRTGTKGMTTLTVGDAHRGGANYTTALGRDVR